MDGEVCGTMPTAGLGGCEQGAVWNGDDPICSPVFLVNADGVGSMSCKVTFGFRDFESLMSFHRSVCGRLCVVSRDDVSYGRYIVHRWVSECSDPSDELIQFAYPKEDGWFACGKHDILDPDKIQAYGYLPNSTLDRVERSLSRRQEALDDAHYIMVDGVTLTLSEMDIPFEGAVSLVGNFRESHLGVCEGADGSSLSNEEVRRLIATNMTRVAGGQWKMNMNPASGVCNPFGFGGRMTP